ncbi:MAG: hypothetical protein AMXMBFR23_22660 [Chloroflexota bacterium]
MSDRCQPNSASSNCAKTPSTGLKNTTEPKVAENAATATHQPWKIRPADAVGCVDGARAVLALTFARTPVYGPSPAGG